MAETSTASVSIQKALLDQVDPLAQHLNISPSRLVEIAVEDFIRNHAAQAPSGEAPQVINQGDIYWVRLDTPDAPATGIPHPHVIVQADFLNHSRIDTVVACALTSNLKRANLPGNVLLDAGAANLPRPSVVETSKISTLYKTQLGDYIGSLAEPQIRQILAGLRLLQSSFFTR